jgi:hypothetical protein
LPIEDQPVTLIDFGQWEPLEPEIADVMAKFMQKVGG